MAQEKPVIKKLKCGGWGIFTIDAKTKMSTQTGYIGANLTLECWLPEGAVVEK